MVSASLALRIGSGSYECPALQRFLGMHRLPGMLGPLWLSPLGMPVTQKQLLSSSCLQQGYYNAPHGAHVTGHFHGIIALQRSVPFQHHF